MNPLVALGVGAGLVVFAFAAVGAAFTIGIAVEARQRRLNQAALGRGPRR